MVDNLLKKIAGTLIGVMLFATGAAAVNLNGAGATFPYPIYAKWIAEYSKASGTQVNYQPIGSGGGVRQFTMGVVDFGGSDAPMTDEEIAKAGGDVLHVPTVLGAVAVVFNLSGIHSLKMDARTLAGIYLGKINKWDDDAIAALNPGINLPNKDILVARRSDGSGTTFIFSAYLSKVSLDWASRVGAGKSLSWPVGVGGKGNAGVAGVVKSKEGAIGYVELSYAVTNKLAMVALKNKSGNFVLPANESTTAAAAGAIAKMPKDFRVDLTNAAGANSYPIIGLTWLLVHKKQANAEKGKALVGFLKWALTSGQQYAPELYYSPLPDGLRSKVLAAVEAIRF